MKIIIVGAGRIGSNLAKALSEEHEVYLIEQDKDVASKVDEKIDVKVVRGSGADPDILKSVHIEDADLVVAVTFSDETNLVVCSLADSFGSKRQIARVRNVALSKELHKSGFKHFYVDEIINPEEVAAQAIVKTIDAPGACEVGDFANGKILLRAFDILENSTLCGVKISDLSDEDFPWPFLIIAVCRQQNIFIPKGDSFLQKDDRIYVFLPEHSLGEFVSFVDPNSKRPSKVIIYGGTTIGERVADSLSGKIKYIILLEENVSQAEEVAKRLVSTTVINGSGAEKDILKESGIEAADIFIAASDNDHSNLISAVLAKKMGAKNTIIITQQPDYMSIVDALDINVIINPHLLAVEQILRLVRGRGISAVRKLLKGEAEALELMPEEGSPITKAPLKDIDFPKNSLVGAVLRDPEVILAKGDTQIRAGEQVIVFCQGGSLKKIQRLFTKNTLF